MKIISEIINHVVGLFVLVLVGGLILSFAVAPLSRQGGGVENLVPGLSLKHVFHDTTRRNATQDVSTLQMVMAIRASVSRN